MNQYLLSVHTVASDAPPTPMSEADMRAMASRIEGLEAEMRSSGTFVFGGRLHDPQTATVVRRGASELVMTDGPYVESKEHIGGFYIINAADLDAALAWAGKVVDCIGSPIEVWPFVDTSSV
jgi:hypothetical protein